MSAPQLNPFDTIESAQDFVRVLAETVTEARQEVELDFQRLQSQPSRQRDALQIAIYNLDRLEKHLSSSRRILNDLRSLRRLLFAERKFRRVRSLPPIESQKIEPLPAIVAAIPAPKPVGSGRMPLSA